mmetsp:Transcript_26441/g.52084  ORF Transcript_26441/g.52084 Transcript_26441/m.52084 type:complete len:1082 (-) Transcript_26441:400-3645(-)
MERTRLQLGDMVLAQTANLNTVCPAPEGNPSDFCWDMWSLGVVIVEMLHLNSFRELQNWERQEQLDAVRAKELAKDSLLGDIARNLLQADPKKRLTAEHLVQLIQSHKNMLHPGTMAFLFSQPCEQPSWASPSSKFPVTFGKTAVRIRSGRENSKDEVVTLDYGRMFRTDHTLCVDPDITWSTFPKILAKGLFKLSAKGHKLRNGGFCWLILLTKTQSNWEVVSHWSEKQSHLMEQAAIRDFFFKFVGTVAVPSVRHNNSHQKPEEFLYDTLLASMQHRSPCSSSSSSPVSSCSSSDPPRLKPFQEEGVQWMVKRETKDRPLQISDLWEEHEFRSLKLCEANLDPECPSPGFQKQYDHDCLKPGTFFRHSIAGTVASSKPHFNDVRGGVLADQMGLGKTIQTFALMQSNLPQSDSANFDNVLRLLNPHNLADSLFDKIRALPNSVIKIILDYHGVCQATLVVCPDALTNQWVEQAKKFKHLCADGPVLYQDLALNLGSKCNLRVDERQLRDPRDLSGSNVVVASRSQVENDHKDKDNGWLTKFVWWRVVFDEAHSFGVRRGRVSNSVLETGYSLTSFHRWCLTGTPVSNQYKLDDLFGLMRLLKLHPFADKKDFWTVAISEPYKSGNPEATKMLHQVLGDICRRNLFAGVADQLHLPDLKLQVHKFELEPIERWEYKLLFVDRFDGDKIFYGDDWQLSPSQHHSRFMQDVVFGYSYFNVVINDVSSATDRCQQGSVLTSSTQREARSRSNTRSESEFQKRKVRIEKEMSPELLETNKKRTQILQPMLHKMEKVAKLHEDKKVASAGLITCNKHGTLMGGGSRFKAIQTEVSKIVSSDPSNKVLIFSRHQNFLRPLERVLKRDPSLSALVTRLKISQPKEAVHEFQDGDNRVLLLNYYQGAEGLNLQGANHIFFIETELSFAARRQAIGRAFRMNQKRPVEVHLFVPKDTVEERIHEATKEWNNFTTANDLDDSIVQSHFRDEWQALVRAGAAETRTEDEKELQSHGCRDQNESFSSCMDSEDTLSSSDPEGGADELLPVRRVSSTATWVSVSTATSTTAEPEENDSDDSDCMPTSTKKHQQ